MMMNNYPTYPNIEAEALFKGQGRLNQLGGIFLNGRPLPPYLRLRIVQLSHAGVKPCEISRQLRISHGCVSKILNRYSKTGSVMPGNIGGSQPKVSNSQIQNAIKQYFTENSNIFSWEVKERLIRDHICTAASVPSISSIGRILRNLKDSNDNKENSRVTSTTQENEKADIDVVNTSEKKSEKRHRTTFSAQNLAHLEGVFAKTHYPDGQQREELAQLTSLPETKIQVWFSNRRARWRRQQESAKTIPVPKPMENANFNQNYCKQSECLFGDWPQIPLRHPEPYPQKQYDPQPNPYCAENTWFNSYFTWPANKF